MEKKVSYQATNSYSTLNKLTKKTKNVWFCCHGLGYLSRYFIRHFSLLNSEENYVIAPQAPSKYYQDSEFEHVGASWLTKENTAKETENVLHYLDAVFAAENTPANTNLILMGFSQGVSVVTRWMASRKIDCAQLVIHSGGIPKELTAEDFNFMERTQVKLIYGTQDKYINEKRIADERSRAEALFKENLEIISFEGDHEVNRSLLAQLAQ